MKKLITYLKITLFALGTFIVGIANGGEDENKSIPSVGILNIKYMQKGVVYEKMPEHTCIGTLIYFNNHHFVLTAASCIYIPELKHMKVTYNVAPLKYNEESELRGDKYFVPLEWKTNQQNHLYNYAFIHLSPTSKKYDSAVLPIIIKEKRLIDKNKEQIELYGYKITNIDFFDPIKLGIGEPFGEPFGSIAYNATSGFVNWFLTKIQNKKIIKEDGTDQMGLENFIKKEGTPLNLRGSPMLLHRNDVQRPTIIGFLVDPREGIALKTMPHKILPNLQAVLAINEKMLREFSAFAKQYRRVPKTN